MTIKNSGGPVHGFHALPMYFFIVTVEIPSVRTGNLEIQVTDYLFHQAVSLTKAMVSKPSLPPAVREVAILVTGAHFRSGYELYAHVIVAEHRGLSDEKLATIVAGQRPTDLSRQEAVAYDFASALVSGGVLPE